MRPGRARMAVPTAFTMGNLAAGFLACAVAVDAELAATLGAAFIMLAVLCDGLDGLLARKMGATSELGGQLDSLADCVSFGVAPAILVGRISAPALGPVAWLLAVFYASCAAYRLARFNLGNGSGEEAHSVFSGLPTTGAAVAAFGLISLYACWNKAADATLFRQTMPVFLLVLALLMVSRVPYTHMGPGRGRPKQRYVMLFVIVPLVLVGLFWNYGVTSFAVSWAYIARGLLLAAGRRVHESHAYKTG